MASSVNQVAKQAISGIDTLSLDPSVKTYTDAIF